MNFQELIRVRRSIRGYRPDPIEDDVIHRVLGAARIAPTAANLQPFDLILVRDADTRSRMMGGYAHEWFCSSPAIVVGCVDPAKAWVRSDGFCAAELDIAIAMDHLILAAADEGLGTCWVVAFDEAKAKEVLGIPDNIRVMVMTPLGYPSAEPRPFVRRRIEDLVHHDRW